MTFRIPTGNFTKVNFQGYLVLRFFPKIGAKMLTFKKLLSGKFCQFNFLQTVLFLLTLLTERKA